MENTPLTELSNEDLLTKRKKAKSNAMLSAGLFGFLVGVAVYSLVKNGIGFFTFFPLCFLFLISNHKNELKAVDQEIAARGLRP